MAAPKGNQFWKLAKAPIGRPKLIESPEILWEKAKEYFTWCDENPLVEEDWVGKDAKSVNRNLMRPYTLTGLATYIGISEFNFRAYGKEESHKDYHAIYAHIAQIIRNQKFEGAAVGLFNAAIIARDLGLVEKVESKTLQQTVELTKDEFKELSNELDGEY